MTTRSGRSSNGGRKKIPKFKLSKRSLSRLEGVHPDLLRVVHAAIQATPVDFTVLEGLRTRERQAELLEAGATRTMNSRHLTGHAVDLGAYVAGKVRWDWPPYYRIADAVKTAAVGEGILIEWGGDWSTFKDGPHWQLPWSDYPIEGGDA
ncbi:MAG: M15 family metallopeptidase [Gammaproteobacteria bacterium]